ncbi:hypothetical protein AG0111_0g3279 [Alternaria gaisen]|uniref:Uncharacterized protein n=1 Tax=Alternaria gaisen TaxID=167740 RepID=A0ACB6FWJ1_9PLEO|nr:hypothetical protein AG0111_0g3279 [Alternaria gaisen]
MSHAAYDSIILSSFCFYLSRFHPESLFWITSVGISYVALVLQHLTTEEDGKYLGTPKNYDQRIEMTPRGEGDAIFSAADLNSRCSIADSGQEDQNDMKRSHDRISNGHLVPKKASHMCNGLSEEGLKTTAPNLLGGNYGGEK